MIEFSDEHIQAFETTRDTELAKLGWFALKGEVPEQAIKISDNDKEGIAFIKRCLVRAKKYLVGLEEDKYYNYWRMIYATEGFLLNSANFDMNPWTQKILTEPLWHPYQRIDVLAGITLMCENNPENTEFFKQLVELTS